MSTLALATLAEDSATLTPHRRLRHATPETVIDDALVRRFVQQDESAFVEIMARYKEKIFTVCLNLLRNHADAEEVTQDTFVRAYRALPKFRGDSSLSTWLHRIALNLSRNRYWFFFRRRKQDSCSLDCALQGNSTATLADLVADTGWSPAQQTVANEFSALVKSCMARLGAPQREILTLCTGLNRSYAEIAALLGISVGTVKSRIARARARLRALLSEACPEFTLGANPREWFLPSHTCYGHLVAA